MSLAYRTTQPIRLLRIQDQVHMVRHQAVGPYFHPCLARLLPKKITVNFLIAVFKEYCLVTIPSLCHVVRKSLRLP